MKRTASEVAEEDLLDLKVEFGTYADNVMEMRTLDVFAQEKLSDQLHRFYKWPREFSSVAIQEFIKFLVLKAQANDIDDKILAPSPVLERVWQAFLFRPKAYVTTCQILFASLIDYNPDEVRAPARLERTLKLYEEFFKRKPITQIWISDNPEEAAGSYRKEKTLEEFRDKIFDLMKEGQRFTYQQLCDRWGYLGKPETLREIYLTLVASAGLVEKELSDSEDEEESSEEAREQKTFVELNAVDWEKNGMGEGYTYFFHCSLVDGELMVRCPGNSKVSTVQQMLAEIFPNRTAEEMQIYAKPSHDTPLQPETTLFENGIFKQARLQLWLGSPRT